MGNNYRFLFSLRWLGVALLGLVLVAGCIGLGIWQHDRYEQRSATNARIEAAAGDTTPSDATRVLSADEAVKDSVLWTKVRATGRFDEKGQVLIRHRSVEGKNGYEVVTPLVLSDGTALLVDRGWVPPADSGATEAPQVPAPPEGSVTVTGTVRDSENKLGTVKEVSGTRQARSVNIPAVSKHLDYPVMRAYITRDEPGEGFTAIPVPTQRAWQNFAYAYQWWLFAVMIPIGLVMIARREAGGVTRRSSAAAA